jgi:hypothetical protein
VNSGILAGIGLAAACGWNTFLPLLVLGLGDRVADGDLLSRPFDFISETTWILLFLVLMTVELVGDKVPRLDHALDILGAVLRPTSGALCFMAVAAHDESVHPILAMLFGLAIGGVVHWDKVNRRIVLAKTGLGLGTPFVSMTEDFVSIVVSVCAVLLGILGPITAIGGWVIIRATYRWSEGFGSSITPRGRSEPDLRR